MDLNKRIIKLSSLKEPYAGGKGNFAERIKANLPFLRLIPKGKKKILVIGCGEGHEVKWLINQGFTAIGVSNNPHEVTAGRKKYQVDLRKADLHQLPFADQSFDSIYASNILEHSVAPFVALQEWRRVLKRKGWMVVIMPSKEWLSEYYHFSVLTHSQMKDLFYKTGFKLLAGPEMKPLISLGEGDVFYDLGRGWGHYDGYLVEKSNRPVKKFMLGNQKKLELKETSFLLGFLKKMFKKPFNIVRSWKVRTHHE